jgi:triacylglycerol lipase
MLRIFNLVCQLLVLALTLVLAPGAAKSSADESGYTAFYLPPDPLPAGRPGDLIRSEPSRIVLEPSGQLGAYMATGTRIMYLSTDGHGEPVAVTGTYFEPDNPWPGNGPRPLLSFAVGTYGQGDQCAPSRLFNQGIHFSSGLDLMINYEEGFIATMLARGYAIVVTDYQGLGTPGVHTYTNRVAQGHAVIDAARAAQRLPDTSLDPHGPVAFWGYSQGGGAVASAAELAPTYAPELKLVGVWSGAPPADMAQALPFLDGSFLVGALGYVLNSTIAAYPEAEQPIRNSLTVYGEDLLNRTKDQCSFETLLTFAFHRLQEYFNTDPAQLGHDEPLKSIFAAQRLGQFRPAVPVMIDQNRFDPLVPYGPTHQLALDWCALGADVELWTNEEPPFLNKLGINHMLTPLVDGERGMQWIADRFNGLPTTPNCGQI